MRWSFYLADYAMLIRPTMGWNVDASDYRRYRVPGGTYFCTVNLLERRLDTLVRHIDLLCEAVRGARQRYPVNQ